MAIIEIPVTIAFDSYPGGPAASRQMTRTFTMRYDTEDTDAPADFALIYPPTKNARWIVDRDGVLFDLFQHDTDKLIAARALADPATYAPANDNTSLDDVDRAIAAVAAEIGQ